MVSTWGALRTRANGAPPNLFFPPAPVEEPAPRPAPAPEQLIRSAIHRRAVEAAIWGMPVVRFDQMYQEMVRKLKGGGFNQILYWPRLPDWKNQTPMPDPGAILLVPFFNTKGGPLVLEMPPADDGLLHGSILNRWQSPVADVGPGGLDRGAGGKYLILPPGHDDAQTPPGYYPVACDSHLAYAPIWSVPESDGAADVEQAAAQARRIKLYPLSRAGDPPATVFLDAGDVVFDSTLRYDFGFFESLQRMVDAEPWAERDRAMIDALKTIGIERGKPFKPSAEAREILGEAIREARAWLDLNYCLTPSCYERGHWFLPAGHEPHYCLMSISDREAKPLESGGQYWLRVPAQAPAQSWSMTVYDRASHAFIRETPWVSRSSRSEGLQWNDDGSCDIYFGAAAPEGRQANWITAAGAERFEVMARFYAPEAALFDKSWRLPDIERIG